MAPAQSRLDALHNLLAQVQDSATAVKQKQKQHQEDMAQWEELSRQEQHAYRDRLRHAGQFEDESVTSFQNTVSNAMHSVRNS